jgi:hypothetical protein
MKFKITLYVMTLLAGLLVDAGPVRADQDPSKDGKKHELLDARTLLEAGQASRSLPAGVVLRVSADLFRTDSENIKARAEAEARGVVFEKSLTETWEFTSNQVYRVVVENENRRSTYRRVKSRPFDSKGLCKELIDGNALEIQAARGKGKPLMFVGTNYYLGGRSIEIRRNGETVLNIGEHCTVAGYAESDARAFAALYERLASQARVLSKSKAAGVK